jgi:hypothetical protein
MIHTSEDLCKVIKTLSVEGLQDIVCTIAITWFQEDDGTLNPDKDLGADQIDSVSQILHSYELFPGGRD